MNQDRLPDDSSVADLRRSILDAERDRAERLLHRVRVIVLLLLAIAAGVYAPSLPRELDRVNLAVLLPTLAWALAQQSLLFRRAALSRWASAINPVVDLTALTALIWGYALVESPGVAFKTPIFGAYFLILAALPVASSTRKAALVSALAVAEYALLLVSAAASGRLRVILDPIEASGAVAVSPLDEGAKLLLLGLAGAVATYATRWYERLTARYADALLQRESFRTRLARSELQFLKLQLQPHFLFNTLNTITALVHRDPARAERMVSGLSELLRASLGGAAEQEVPLGRELEVLQHYIEIQQVRFEDRLRVAIEVAPEVLRAYIPNLMLQPLVENAIKHGLSHRAAAGLVRVSAARMDGRLVLEVRDNGVGEAAPEDRREGVGLANTRARLRSLYEDEHRFLAGGVAEGGFSVRIELPYHEAAIGRHVADGS